MAKAARVLVIMNSGIRKHGSFEDYMVQFAREARRRGWDLGFIFPAVGAPNVIDQLQSEGSTSFVVDAPWKSKKGAAELARLIREFKPTLVNFHFCGPVALWRTFLFCRFRSIPTVFHYHGEILPLTRLRWRNRHFSTLRLMSAFWTRIITVSQANERFLRALHVAKPIDVVYNGIDLPRFLEQSADTEESAPAKIEGGPLQCLYMGSLIERKRVDVLLRAFAIVRQSFPNARLVIVGEGRLQGDLKILATELKLDDAVQFTGLLIEYPFDRLRQSDIFVSASESESFGLVLAEAMSFQLPVVACRVGGIPEVVADGVTGILVEPNDPEALAGALLTLLEDRSLRLDMGKAAVQRVAARFRLDETVKATFAIFESLA
jgi:glycosyltransferase involved in cell wall biosynthesis